MRQGPLTAIAWRPARLPFKGCTLQPGMFRSESAAAAWSASIALLQRLCRSGGTFRPLPVSNSSRSPACRKLTITVSSVKRDATECQLLIYNRPGSGASRQPSEPAAPEASWTCGRSFLNGFEHRCSAARQGSTRRPGSRSTWTLRPGALSSSAEDHPLRGCARSHAFCCVWPSHRTARGNSSILTHSSVGA